ncbi:MAG: hypothetical protein K9M57_04180, partial [Phycisphaerae bacterium]|nr:hypothetical protein [Phycisphaerae bacterium]
LTPTVLNNDPNDPQAPLSYLWTVDPTEGVELSDATAMAPTITITQPSLYTSYLADPGLNDQGGWDAIGGGIGYYNSSFSNYTVEGAMCADIWGAPAGENGYAQTLAATLETDTEYELSVWLGTPDGYTAPIGYKVQLLAGGTVLAEEVADANSLPAVGVAVQSTVTFDSTGVDTGLVGQPLEIRLLGVMAAVDRENFGFDAAKLLINGKEMAIPGSSVPDPYTIDLKLAVTLEDEATVYDTVVIDVYDNACLAAAGADPAFKLDLGDINGDCITNLEDFAKLAAEWLVDYKATGPVAKPEI